MQADIKSPVIIALVGVDGCGKTTLSSWLEDKMRQEGLVVKRVWTRFRNYLSKPLLGLTRLSGHNRYQNVNGHWFGTHNFEKLPIYRELFAFLQAVDVNIAAYHYIKKKGQRADVVICERCPWDSLVDVVSDTDLLWLIKSWLGEAYVLSLKKNTKVLWVMRDTDKILSTRPELVHDRKLQKRADIYRQLAELHGWTRIDNNGYLNCTKKKLISSLRSALDF